MTAMTLATIGVLSAVPLFCTRPTSFLGGIAAAAGIGLINSIGNLARFVSPFVVGKISDFTHSLEIGFWVIAASLLFCGLLVITMKDPKRPEHR